MALETGQGRRRRSG